MTGQITSRNNHRIKEIRKLHNKKGRQESSRFYVEGLKLVGDALEWKTAIESVIYCPELLVSEFGQQILRKAGDQHIEIINVSMDVFSSFAIKSGPQGIAAVIRQNWVEHEKANLAEGLWIALENVQDPGNLGSTLRSLDGAGGQGMLLLDHAADAYHPTAVRASMGSVFSQKLVKTTTEELARWKKQNECMIVGTWCGDAQAYRSYNYPKDMILMMGSEQKGLQEEHLVLCDQLVHIPMSGFVDSLNLACSASVVLFEIHNQHRNQETK